jgi:hypothetical protein
MHAARAGSHLRIFHLHVLIAAHEYDHLAVVIVRARDPHLKSP